jgi:phosphatidylserine/phosphatidylglycerophosphate/cardiolipin synthase-like enzyme
MTSIAKVVAFTNGEIAYVSWTLKNMIPGCLGFEITRIYPGSPQDNTVLPAWVAFTGQSNKKWLPQDTSVWPVQKLSWKDFTLRKKRDATVRRPNGTSVQYLVRPVVVFDKNLDEVKSSLKVTYTGKAVRLSYVDKGELSNVINVDINYGSIRATFTNGILATQYLAHAMKNPKFGKIKNAIATENNPTRQYLAGDALETLTMLLKKAEKKANATLKMALYELDDKELFDAIMANKEKVTIILSNTSADSKGVWDKENGPNRATLHKAKVKISDRMFNNAASIGHNKFVIYLEDNIPLQVMTGSTNWTSNGLCAQSNNSVVIDSPQVAAVYNKYFDALSKDNDGFTVPQTISATTKNVQGQPFRTQNSKGTKPVKLKDGTIVKLWFSPNTPKVSVNKKIVPPDLSEVFSIMRKAGKAIFFAVFYPGAANNRSDDGIMTNIITEAITLGEKDHSLMVYGAISEPKAMPNYITPVKGKKSPETPGTYNQGKLHIVRALNLKEPDLIGDFEQELLSLGHAIIHDKIVVVDPFSKNGTVIFGSHNQGFKASYGNDENLLIIQNNPPLVRAFALHVLDIFEHYRFRAVQHDLELAKKNKWDGYLSTDDAWLQKAMASGGKGDLAAYMTEAE